MASNAKKKTTFAKLNREAALRERRVLKQMKKDARKQEAAAAGREPGSGPPIAETPTDDL